MSPISQKKLSVEDSSGKRIPYLLKEYPDRIEFYKFYKYKEATLNLIILECNCVASKLNKNSCIHVKISKDMGVRKSTEGAYNIEL